MNPYSGSVESPRSVACIGVFDGVHRGHQHLISIAQATARTTDAELVAVTFDPHPLRIVKPKSAPLMLTTIFQRTQLLKEAGASRVHVIDFTHEVAEMTSEEFVLETLVNQLNVSAVVVGSNFTFGYQAQGNVDTLRQLGEKYSFTVTEVALAGDSLPISSSRIRALLTEGRISDAQVLLGHPFALGGEVIYGDQRGRDLGYPTANLQWAAHMLIPADGVYAGFVLHHGSAHPAAISVGTNPQFEGIDRRVEAFILDRTDFDLYGKYVEFEFKQYLRPQQTFPDLEAYLAQMRIDVDRAREVAQGA